MPKRHSSLYPYETHFSVKCASEERCIFYGCNSYSLSGFFSVALLNYLPPVPRRTLECGIHCPTGSCCGSLYPTWPAMALISWGMARASFQVMLAFQDLLFSLYTSLHMWIIWSSLPLSTSFLLLFYPLFVVPFQLGDFLS